MMHALLILFLFALGACVGSFLNVVVWRLPRGQSLVSPPSHCPKCQTPLRWYDNVPVLGWLMLSGRCRYCGERISPKYPLVEAATGALFVFYYVMFFMLQIGPCPPVERQIDPPSYWYVLTLADHWPILALTLFMVSALLAASLIDAELFIIPLEIPWLMALVGIVAHALIDTPLTPGAVSVGPTAAALAAGGLLGLLISMTMWAIGWMPTSFPQGEPLLEVDRAELLIEMEKAKRAGREAPPVPPPYTPREIRREMNKELLFLLPPTVLAAAALLSLWYVEPTQAFWHDVAGRQWLSGLLGAIWGALIGAGIIWVTRILGTLAFGRVAMGLGDVHLMLGIGAIVGAGAAVVTFFLAPFFGLLIAVYMLLTGTRRELPYGPYLSLAAAAVVLFYCPIFEWLRPGIEGAIFLMGM
jgi:leader peptidase (prepilin peptidase) / N-methyltransferase